MEKALACHLEIGAPTVGHDPAITTAYENRWAIFRRVSLRIYKDWEKGEHARYCTLRCTPRRAPCLLSPVWKHLRRWGPHLLSLIL